MRGNGPWRTLVRHFFNRFFDTESISPHGEAEANVVQTLGFLAAPGAILALLLQLVTARGWSMVSTRCLFISFSMIVMGFLVVFEWDVLFPDRRDYQVLTPLPLRLSTLFLAKAAAIGLFLGMFLLDVNFFSTALWPGIDNGKDLLGIVGAHLATVLLSGVFAALAMASVQGALLNVLPAPAFRRVSVVLQTVLMALLVMLLFLSPMVAGRLPVLIRQHSALVYAWPGYWFTGFYESLRPAVRNGDLAGLGPFALQSLAIAAAFFVLTYLPGYRRHMRKLLEGPQLSHAGPGEIAHAMTGWLDRWILPDPPQRAVFHFISHTITRSMKHRLFLASYAGVGGTIAVLTFGSGTSALLYLPLTLSFILVSALRAAFNFPADLRCNWMFQISETNRGSSYRKAVRKWVVVCAVVPLFAILAPMEFVCFPWQTAVFHLAYGITLSALLMELMFLGFHKVPFTCSYLPGKINLVALAVTYCFGFTFYSRSMAGLEQWLVDTPAAAVGFFAVAATGYAVLAYWRERLGAEEALDFEDAGEPEVRTLELQA